MTILCTIKEVKILKYFSELFILIRKNFAKILTESGARINIQNGSEH